MPLRSKGEFALDIKLSRKGTTLIIKIMEDMDHHSAQYLRQKIDFEIVKATVKNIIFDFSNVNFMDSSGIGVVVGRYKNIQKLNGKAAIVNANPKIMQIFEMSGVLKIIPAYSNLDKAISGMCG
jgi:stage II sporulation protein AA (anti-sigma F factor antagonist)